jgi:hypothetical protein
LVEIWVTGLLTRRGSDTRSPTSYLLSLLDPQQGGTDAASSLSGVLEVGDRRDELAFFNLLHDHFGRLAT